MGKSVVTSCEVGQDATLGGMHSRVVGGGPVDAKRLHWAKPMPTHRALPPSILEEKIVPSKCQEPPWIPPKSQTPIQLQFHARSLDQWLETSPNII